MLILETVNYLCRGYYVNLHVVIQITQFLNIKYYIYYMPKSSYLIHLQINKAKKILLKDYEIFKVQKSVYQQNDCFIRCENE